MKITLVLFFYFFFLILSFVCVNVFHLPFIYHLYNPFDIIVYIIIFYILYKVIIFFIK